MSFFIRLDIIIFTVYHLTMKTAAIILKTPLDIARVAETDVICADAGYYKLCGVTPIAVVGDFDSGDDIPSNVKKITFPVEKNETDGQLAEDYAKLLGYEKVVIYGALGGKIEHILGNLGLLLHAHDLGLSAVIKEPQVTIELLTGSFRRAVNVNDSISFYPLCGDVLVKHSYGLYYPLENLLLTADTGRSISNVAKEKEIGLDFTDGRLLLIRYL